MNYSIKAKSVSKKSASISIKDSEFQFGITPEYADSLANPAELFLASFAACVLKNVERFSTLTNFEYSQAEIIVDAIRLEKPPRMDSISYKLTIYSQDKKLNLELLKRNIENYGTIYNTIQSSCSIEGKLEKLDIERS